MPDRISIGAHEDDSVNHFIHRIWKALSFEGDYESTRFLAPEITGNGALTSAFAVTSLATASIASAGMALSELISLSDNNAPKVKVDRRLSSFWFASSVRPIGWSLPPSWDAIAGDYQTSDGWIRLHTNAPRHREAALAVLGTNADKTSVAKAVCKWSSDELENAIVDMRGCAAAMKDRNTWLQHAQGKAVGEEPLVHRISHLAETKKNRKIDPHRPLHGVKVLDLTRIIAGPVATRFLAGYGAEVLRLDPPGWDEPSLLAELTIGKRCARLDLKNAEDRRQFEQLLREADVLVHGYRANALESLGLGTERRRQINPSLIDVSLNAYGHSGPWRNRRGFDSLVQMSCGIADAGMRHYGKTLPTPLPVQALDHATGYMMAAAVIRGLSQRHSHRTGSEMRLSLARTAELFIAGSHHPRQEISFSGESEKDHSLKVENTIWGTSQRLLPPLEIVEAPMQWSTSAGNLGTVRATWS
ncbi:CoA transferase [Undibacterium sp. SXout20W]|uniref:CoA transferase n=1 Tax=Undibacterium sp. SXout20W TaxID=3413051 RepID=UPI003BF1A680